MIQIIGTLVYFGLGTIAALFNASQRNRFNETVSYHNKTVEICKQRIATVTRRASGSVALAQAKAEYRTAISAGNAAWEFMNSTREELNQIWSGIMTLQARILSANSSQRYEIIAAIKELRSTHAAIRVNLYDLKDRVRQLNHQTALLKQRFVQLGEAGITYYRHLQGRQCQK